MNNYEQKQSLYISELIFHVCRIFHDSPKLFSISEFSVRDHQKK
ncbi:hypothetical protein TcasGA2_TC033328, partial [Tribolium castaneum]